MDGQTPAGLRFVRMDLHVHTPASHDFAPRDGSVTPAAFVEACIARGLSAVAITDHNTGEWIDAVREAAGGTSLVIFPGVEILATGGESGIHVIGIFDVDRDTAHVTALLGSLGIDPATYGTSSAVSAKGVAEVVRTIAEPPFSGIAILAHCTSSKGVLADMRGQTRKRVFREPGLLGVEASQSDFANELRAQKRARAIDLLDGTREEYCYRRLGVYQASDNRSASRADCHGLEGIGSAFGYFKVDLPLRLESLRQCLIDRDVRIRQPDEYQEAQVPRIESLKISSGFFEDSTFRFHAGLNSVIGSKGAGKSLLVECLRFAFGQPPTESRIREDHDGKLECRLGQYGRVEVTFRDDSGQPVTFNRTFDPADGHPMDGPSAESLARTFPIIFLSQNEIIRIASDEQQQLQFIDGFFDFRAFRRRIDDVEAKLRELDRDLAGCFVAYRAERAISEEIKEIEREVKEVAGSLQSEILKKYVTGETRREYGELILGQLQRLVEILEDAGRETGLVEIPKLPEDVVSEAVSMRTRKALADARAGLSARLEKVESWAAGVVKEVTEDLRQANGSFGPVREEYEQFILAKGSDAKGLEARRKDLLSRKEALNRRHVGVRAQAARLRVLRGERDELLGVLSTVRSDYFEARRERCRRFEKDSADKLRVLIEEARNTEAFAAALRRQGEGSYIRKAVLEEFAAKVPPREFVRGVVNFDLTGSPAILLGTATDRGVDSEKFVSLAAHVLKHCSHEQILALEYNAPAEDRPTISYDVGEGDYVPLADLSVGQKCTAMLLMSLSDGAAPVVLDQPEDSLDLKGIWDDMCVRVRRAKEQRQFIFTTHNSSLAVASDSDCYIVVEADAHRGRVLDQGAIDRSAIRDHVITYLEGGDETYGRKASKYDFPRQRGGKAE